MIKLKIGSDEHLQPERLELIDEYVRRTAQSRADHIEMMAAAYMKATNLPPDRVELVEEQRG
jgi:hypothetical protein